MLRKKRARGGGAAWELRSTPRCASCLTMPCNVSALGTQARACITGECHDRGCANASVRVAGEHVCPANEEPAHANDGMWQAYLDDEDEGGQVPEDL